MTDRCAFWIASSKYLAEAQASAERFRQVMPDVPTYLFYIDPVSLEELPEFDGIVGMPRMHKYWYLDSVNAMLYSHKVLNRNSIYFDTDTYLVEPVYEIFEMLEHGYDFVAAHAPGRHTAPTVNPIPDSFPEFNVGVCGFGNLAKSKLANEWYRQYDKHQDTYGNNDQASLREVLWNDKYHVGTLPPEYNFRFNFGGFLRYPVKVLHGRNPDLARVAKSVNEHNSMRLWRLSDMEYKKMHFNTVLDKERGNLTFIELPQDIGFDVKRIFYVYDNPFGVVRGKHTHKTCKQVLIVLRGMVTVKTPNGGCLLQDPGDGCFIDAGIYSEIIFHEEDSVLLVLASEHYAPEDYVNEYQVS